MCGIVGFTGAQEAAPILPDGLRRLEYRGYDSAGIAVQRETGRCMAKAGGKIRHPCQLIHEGSELRGFAGIGHTRRATHGAPTDQNAHPEECKARGAKVLAVAPEGNRQIFAKADDVIFIPETDPLLQVIPEIVPLQLLAYYVALEDGCDIDKPKNPAKSVTVE